MKTVSAKTEINHDHRVSLQNLKNSEKVQKQISEIYANRSELKKQAKDPIKKDQKNEGRK